MKQAILHANVVTRNGILENYAVIYDDKIQDICPSDQATDYEQFIDAEGQYLLPGLIDMHIHGFGGHDVMDATPAALQAISKGLLQNGVTAYLPTTVTMGKTETDNALVNLRREMAAQSAGAKILGVHMEGPYLNPVYKGAHEESLLAPPDIAYVTDYLDIFRMITVAPELNREFVRWASAQGLIISMGHTNATYEEAQRAIDAGASHVTHLFNAMSGLHHQRMGMVGAALLHDALDVELIADTVHVRRELFNMVYRMKGPNRIILVTDCTRAGGMPAGEYMLGALLCHSDGETSIRLPDGTLAGSILRLNRAVYNFHHFAHVPLYEAVAMASYNPARALGLADSMGSIDIGRFADFSLADEKMNVQQTFQNGNVVFKA